MIALLSALLGFVSSAIPEFIKLFKDGKDRAHEVTLLKLQMEYAKVEQQQKLQAIELESWRAEDAALNGRVQSVGTPWVDALSGSVRPVITYGFFLLYVAVKAAQFSLLVSPALPWHEPLNTAQALVVLWSEEDIAIFSAIMAFWFGSRMMRRK